MYYFSLFTDNVHGTSIVKQDVSSTTKQKKNNKNKIIQFPNTPEGYKRTNIPKGVYPIRKYEKILAMANWLYLNKDPKYVLAFVIGCNVGLRANELLKLRYSQVFDENGDIRFIEDLEDTSDVIKIYQGKTDKDRPIFLNRACKDALEWLFPDKEQRLKKDNYLFPSREGECIEVDTFRKVLKEAAKACGVKENIGTHTLRKTFGYHLFHTQSSEVRTDVTLIQSMYGHSAPRITMRYLGLDIYEFKSAYHKVNLNVVADPKFAAFEHQKTAEMSV